ncbi:MAG: clan AA aspartic protease [Planctomycetes bacterium]|nr:clan AA aspartic protease [Planctomycetota bacterium]
MITGVVNRSEARIRRRIKGRGKREIEIDAIVDTGFTSWLTLLLAAIADLDLNWFGFDTAILGDGSTCSYDVYSAKVLWDGKLREILVDEADSEPLVGMRMLKGHRVMVDVRSRGSVTIKHIRRGT